MNCPEHENGVGCEKSQGIRDAVRGLGVTLVNFPCKKRLSERQPGQRVKLTLRERGEEIWVGPDEVDTEWDDNEYEGTIMRPTKGTRILVWLDEPTRRECNPIAVRPNGVTPIEGTRELCRECQQPDGTTRTDSPKGCKSGEGKIWCETCDAREQGDANGKT